VNRVSFDEQAATYDARAGIPVPISAQVSDFLFQGLSQTSTLVDVGAGTGAIGLLLSVAVRYVGIDLSRPMLEKYKASTRLQADAETTWPLADHCADVILFSRSAHLLKNEAVLGEVLRVGKKGARIFIGRVKRPRESAGEQLKRTMQHMLRDRGVPGRNGERAARDFLETLERHGARRLPEWRSDSWSEDEAILDSLESWKGKDGLSGRVVDDGLKAQVLDELSVWAEEQFGDLKKRQPVPRHYQLECVQLAE
jgi:ubiquinone/menaquinone biosynthesis C-methylase UbiE